MSSFRERIVNVLLSRGLVQQDQLDEALALQRARGGSLQKILVEKGLVSEADFLAAISQGLGIPPITLGRIKLDPSLKTLISRELALQYEVLPVSCIGDILTVAMADPSNVQAIEDVELLTKCVVQTFVSTPSDIEKAIAKHYKHGSNNNSPAKGKRAGAPDDKTV